LIYYSSSSAAANKSIIILLQTQLMFWENFQLCENADSRSAVAEDASVLQYDNVSLGEWFPTFHFEIHADQQVSCTAGPLQMKIKRSSATS
jgi:hypothetical protein